MPYGPHELDPRIHDEVVIFVWGAEELHDAFTLLAIRSDEIILSAVDLIDTVVDKLSIRVADENAEGEFSFVHAV